MAHVAMDTRFPDSPEAAELGRLLGNRLAWCHALRIWAWGIDQSREDGTFNLEPERIAEIASYRGDPEDFVAALIVVGLLELRDDGSYYMNGWRRNREFFAKKRRMQEYRRKLDSAKRGSAATSPDMSQETSRVASPDASRVPRSPSPSPSLKKEDGLSPGIEQVVAHYLERYPGRAAQAKKAANKIRARLKEGYSAQQLRDAIDGNAASEWHVDNNHTHIDQIVGSAKKVDLFLDRLAKGRPSQQQPPASGLVALPDDPTPEERAASIEAMHRVRAGLSATAIEVAS